ncbi:MAG: hypothetical protein WA840_22595 [Caulobacteraceae bacterium]
MGGGLGMHLFQTPMAQFSALIAAVLCITAVIWGRWPERLGSFANALNCVGGALVQDRRWNHHGQPGVFAADAALLLVLLFMTVRSRRTWVLWAAACTLLLNLTDLCLLLDARIQLWSYVTATYVWGFGGVAALAAGIAFEGRRPVARLSFGADARSARPSTPSATARTRS